MYVVESQLSQTLLQKCFSSYLLFMHYWWSIWWSIIGVATRGSKGATAPLLFLVPAFVKDRDTLIEQSITLMKCKEAVYGKFMEQIRTMRANKNGFGGDDLFFWSSALHTREITKSSIMENNLLSLCHANNKLVWKWLLCIYVVMYHEPH